MPNKLILTALFAAAVLPSQAASDLSDLLNTYLGDSQQDSATVITQPSFLSGTNLEVSSIVVGASTQARTVFFENATPSANNFTGVDFGRSAGDSNNGRNYLRTVGLGYEDYHTQDFKAYVTVRRSGPIAPVTSRRSVFIGLGTGALNAVGSNPDAGTLNAAVYFEMQNGFNNVSRRAQGESTNLSNRELGYKEMDTVQSDSMRMELSYNSVTRVLTFAVDYGYVPGQPFVADQTFPQIDLKFVKTSSPPYDLNTIGQEWNAGDRASIFFGGDRSVVFTDLVIDVTQPPTAPTPTLAIPTFASGVVNLNWSSYAIPDTTYAVFRSTTAGSFLDPAIATDLTSTTYSDTTVINGTTYYYHVVQSNTVAAAASVPSNEVTATPVSGAVSPTAVVAVNGGEAALVVDWSDLLSPFDTYTVRRSTTSGGPYTIPAGGSGLTESRFLDETVVDGVTYYYTVTSTLSGSESSPSAEVSSASRSLEVFVDFNAGTPTYTGAGGLATSPVGTSWNGIGIQSVPYLSDSTSALTSAGLNATGVGTFAKANGFGVGGDNATPNSQTLSQPGAHDLMQDYVFVSAGGTITTYTLTGLVPARKYDLYLYGYGDVLGQNVLFGSNGIQKQTSNPAGLTTLTEGRHFVTFTAVADTTGNVEFTFRNMFGSEDADANSGASMINGFQLVENATAVLQPQFLGAFGTLDAVEVSWDSVDGATSYQVYRSTTRATGYTLLADAGNNTFYDDTSAVPGTPYFYVVKALNGTVESFFSAEASGTRELLIVDADLDGLSDSDEALIGTDPNDPSDFFVAPTSTATPNAGNFDVAFTIKGAPGTYVIERSTTLAEGSWTEIPASSQNFTWSTGTVLDHTLNLSAPGVAPAPGGKEFFRAKGVAPGPGQ